MKKLKKGDIVYANDGLGRKMFVEITEVREDGEYGIMDLEDEINYIMPSSRNVIEKIDAKSMTLRYLKEKREWEKKCADLKRECENLNYGTSLQENRIYRLEQENERLKKLVKCVKGCPMLAEQIKDEEENENV